MGCHPAAAHAESWAPQQARRHMQAGVHMLYKGRGLDSLEPVRYIGAQAYHELSMSMKGLTCRALGLTSPAGLNTKLTRSPQGVLVTCSSSGSSSGRSSRVLFPCHQGQGLNSIIAHQQQPVHASCSCCCSVTHWSGPGSLLIPVCCCKQTCSYPHSICKVPTSAFSPGDVF